MAGSSYIFLTVPKLMGHETYCDWCFAADNFLVLEGMIKCIKPEIRKVLEPAHDAETKAKSMQRNNITRTITLM